MIPLILQLKTECIHVTNRNEKAYIKDQIRAYTVYNSYPTLYIKVNNYNNIICIIIIVYVPI